MSRALAAVAGGVLAVAGLCLAFPPGRFDAAAGDVTQTMGHDEGYWSAPARETWGETRFDAYDRARALALALPENALAVAANALGASPAVARQAGSIAAAFSIGALAAAGSWLGALAVLAFLATPIVFGPLRCDLGEGTAIGIVALWAVAASRGRWAIAGFLAGIGLHQKGCGLFVAVGCLAGTCLGGPGRGARVLRAAAFSRAAMGGAAGVALCVAIATAVFHDAPLAFLLRPWRATGDFWKAPSLLSTAVQSAFPGFALGGQYACLPFAAAALVAARRRVSPGWAAACLAGLLYRGYFAANWRLGPVLPLLLLPALAPRREDGSLDLWGALVSAVAAVQATSAAAAWAGLEPGAGGLAVAGVVAVGLVHVAVKRLPRATALAAAALAAAGALVGPWRAAADPELRSTRMHDLAALVASKVDEGEPLVGQPVLSLAHRGLFFLAPFERFWRGELDASTAPRVHRVRVIATPGEPPTYAAPAGRRLATTVPLGTWPYAPESTPRDLVLDVWERVP